MAESQLYTNTYSTIGGAVLSQVTDVTINKNPDLKAVATLALGFAGVNLGAAICEITLETAVPSADFELNPDKFMTIGQQVELGFVAAGRQMQGKMFISGSSYKQGVGQPANLTISLIGPIAPWE